MLGAETHDCGSSQSRMREHQGLRGRDALFSQFASCSMHCDLFCREERYRQEFVIVQHALYNIVQLWPQSRPQETNIVVV